MKRAPFVLALAASTCATFGACSSNDRPSETGAGTLPCAVDDVLARRCRQCHQDPPLFSAPMPLVTYADLHAPAFSDASVHAYEMVGRRIHDDHKPMPQPPNARLSASDMAVLDQWIAAGAPSGASCSAPGQDGGGGTDGGPVGDGGSGVDGASSDGGSGGDAGVPPTCPDLHMAPASPWQMPQATGDVYVCYGVDVTPAMKRHAISFAPRIDNAKIVHHLILLQADKSYPATPAACQFNDIFQMRMVYGWAPGGMPLETPPEAGFPLDANTTTHYVVQIHYSNPLALAGQQDATGIDVCTTDQLRANDADTLAFGSMNFTIQPHSTLHWQCDFTVPNGLPRVHTFAALPHMHQIGKSISTVELPGGTGSPVDMGNQPNWSFQNQVWFPISADVGPGDLVRTRCVWQNDGAQPVSVGENTADEMCFSFTMYYPKIQSALWSWALPAEQSKCADVP